MNRMVFFVGITVAMTVITVLGWTIGSKFRSPAALGESDSLRLDHYNIESLLGANDIVVGGTVTSQRQVTIPGQSPSAVFREDRVVSFTVDRVFRGDGIAAGDTISPHWTTKVTFPASTAGPATIMTDSPVKLVDGKRYVLFLSWHPEADGSQMLAPTGEPGVAAVEGDTLSLLGSSDYLNARAEKGLAKSVPPELLRISFDALTKAIATDDDARVRLASLPRPGLEENPRGKAIEQLMYDLPTLTTQEQVLNRVKELGLDRATLQDEAFCRKVQAVADQFGTARVSLGCGAP